MEWVKVVTLTEPWKTGDARYDGVFDTYQEAQASFIEGMVALGIDRWRASSPRDVGFFRRVWWAGDIETGRTVAGWEPWLSAPDEDARVITVRELCGEFFREPAGG